MRTTTQPIPATADLSACKTRFLNRELSDLAFISRVLEESGNAKHPLLERLRFLSISADVLDQFYTVRVAKMRRKLERQPNSYGVDGLTPCEELTAIDQAADQLTSQQQEAWLRIRSALDGEGIHLAGHYELHEHEHDFLLKYFKEHVQPVLSLFTIDLEHPFPFIPSGGICIVLELEEEKTHEASKLLIPLPHIVPRFVRLPGEELRFASLETMIFLSWHEMFPEHKVTGTGLFQILRDNDLALEERSGDLTTLIESGLKRRHRANGIRLKVNAGMPESLRVFVTRELDMLSEDEINAFHEQGKSVVESEYIGICGLLGLADTTQIIVDVMEEDLPNLCFPSFTPRMPHRLTEFNNDFFATIKEKDLLVHWPFETFDVLVAFIEQSATDDQVVAIKQTLYRTSDQSPIVDALVRAAESGKSVTVVVELEARDNERSNIDLSRRLEAAGAQVIFGLSGLKVHCKATSVIRREGDHTSTYTHYGTGNYHPGNAKVYTDLSFFTCNTPLSHDATALFNFLTSGSGPHGAKHLMIAPKTLRTEVFRLIDKEIEFALAGKASSIWIKVNSLTDPDVIDRLYKASQAGVMISLIVRRHCRLRPGIPGLSENIEVRSIVGRFLEHSRIYCFGNGNPLPSDDAKVFIGSADWMERNFDDRVEVILPVFEPTVKKQVLDQIMVANIKDDLQSWRLSADGEYQRLTPVGDGFSSQKYFLDNPNLSGLGSKRAEVKIPKLSLTR